MFIFAGSCDEVKHCKIPRIHLCTPCMVKFLSQTLFLFVFLLNGFINCLTKLILLVLVYFVYVCVCGGGKKQKGELNTETQILNKIDA